MSGEKTKLMNDRKKIETVIIELDVEQRATLALAAREGEQSLRQFILNSAMARAAEILPDRGHFVLPDEAWNAFQNSLEKAPASKTRLRQLLVKKSKFDFGTLD
ncbi:MAG: hypothetical protein CTY31_13755 [Hyphomicrobium sp.]|nr:MAG: hypothetical protein CTY39_06995 [Hyphomicrobium sp.]PPC98263.1 MAG: hypothetical protein CTY31_13755 [Hyphomicrobium sp.]